MIRESQLESLSGQVDLYLPTDWIDLLETGTDSGTDSDVHRAAQRDFTDLLRRMSPVLSPSEVRECAEALLGWRTTLLALGAVSHGIVNCPAESSLDEDRPDQEAGAGQPWCAWHIVTAVTELSHLPFDVDLGEVLARLIGAGLEHGTAQTERFTTDLGCGAGLILQPPFPTAPAGAGPATGSDLRHHEDRRRYGLATAISCRPGGGPTLVVVGLCLDPEQVLELAAVVAVIAGRSTLPAPGRPGGGPP